MSSGPPLLPDTDVLREDGRWRATGPEPWLRLPGLERRRGSWVRLRYHQGLFDEVVRPLLRFRLANGNEERAAMNGAPFGVGLWEGRVPDGTVEAAISPVRRPGPFSFAVTEVRGLSRAGLLARGFWRQPAMASTALGARLIGAREEARHCLAFAALATPLARYADWKRRRSRPAELEGFDRPRPAPRDRPILHLLIRPEADDGATRRTLASLEAQGHGGWRAWPLGGTRPDERAPEELGGGDDLVMAIDAGDEALPHALAILAEAMAAAPALLGCYGDEEVADAAGGRVRPRFKPDPSPLFEASAGYIGRGAAIRLAALAGRAATLAEVAALPSLLGGLPAGSIAHIRRPLFRVRARPDRPLRPSAPSLPAERPHATVVIPTRDRPELLGACLRGLARTDGRLEVVLVDNGTTEPAALTLLAEASRRPDVTVLRAPGPFNYAALCNAGAAQGAAPLLLFLNNDVEAVTPDWLARLAVHAVRPEIGAVGARLLFPDGRLQHGGVVVGMGGTALHLGRGLPDKPGYLDLFTSPREVGAVTGAVLAVERAKFGAVGGFDAESFPVLLNDIDLCLRLAARGWCTVYEPNATLIHQESASRGRAMRPLLRHAEERARFARRWGARIRHDPCFHPALSLWSIPPALA